MQSETLVKELRNPASAAVAGIIFSVILIVVLVQFHGSVPAGQTLHGLAERPGTAARA